MNRKYQDYVRFPAEIKFVLIWVEYTSQIKKKNTVQRSKIHPTRRAMVSHGDAFLLPTEARNPRPILLDRFSVCFQNKKKKSVLLHLTNCFFS